jgi:hypothetical protein
VGGGLGVRGVVLGRGPAGEGAVGLLGARERAEGRGGSTLRTDVCCNSRNVHLCQKVF